MYKQRNKLSGVRRNRRLKAQLRVLFQRSGWAHFLDAQTENISPGGVYVWTRRRPLDVGTDVSLLLQLDPIERELMLQGVVTWVHKSRPVGMGIRFVNMDSTSKALLSDALQSHDWALTRLRGRSA